MLDVELILSGAAAGTQCKEHLAVSNVEAAPAKRLTNRASVATSCTDQVNTDLAHDSPSRL